MRSPAPRAGELRGGRRWGGAEQGPLPLGTAPVQVTEGRGGGALQTGGQCLPEKPWNVHFPHAFTRSHSHPPIHATHPLQVVRPRLRAGTKLLSAPSPDDLEPRDEGEGRGPDPHLEEGWEGVWEDMQKAPVPATAEAAGSRASGATAPPQLPLLPGSPPSASSHLERSPPLPSRLSCQETCHSPRPGRLPTQPWVYRSLGPLLRSCCEPR